MFCFLKHPLKPVQSKIKPLCSLLPSAVVVLEWVKRVPIATFSQGIWSTLYRVLKGGVSKGRGQLGNPRDS